MVFLCGVIMFYIWFYMCFHGFVSWFHVVLYCFIELYVCGLLWSHMLHLVLNGLLSFLWFNYGVYCDFQVPLGHCSLRIPSWMGYVIAVIRRANGVFFLKQR